MTVDTDRESANKHRGDDPADVTSVPATGLPPEIAGACLHVEFYR
jgi:hypothetical protein